MIEQPAEGFRLPAGLFSLTWAGTGHKAQTPADPAYPDGMLVVLAEGRVPACGLAFPYPAPEIGQHVLECLICGFRVRVTATGRADDPRGIVIACMGLAEA